MTGGKNTVLNPPYGKMPKILNENILSNLCKQYKKEIGNNQYKGWPFPRIRYVIDRNKFGYADFGNFFFWDDGGLYVWMQEEEFKDWHNQEIVEDYFGESCDGRGYAVRFIFAGTNTGYTDSRGHQMFTGDIVLVKETENYETGALCLASAVGTQPSDGFYGFPLDNFSLHLDMCKRDGYYLERIGTIFYQLDSCEEPMPIWNKAVLYNNARHNADEEKARRIMAKFTPNFDKEEWKYLGLEILGAKFDWDKQEQ